MKIYINLNLYNLLYTQRHKKFPPRKVELSLDDKKKYFNLSNLGIDYFQKLRNHKIVEILYLLIMKVKLHKIVARFHRFSNNCLINYNWYLQNLTLLNNIPFTKRA